ncbi:CHAP domain-containing protein [Patulibacter sp. SYSU D01012]|uniref:CHAP domain-containing protein n=1 Tax=Patulibacter sp. SYSU D01012 TaxID=2817381 RepID=UPI001B316374|nr:CHAP domain-containing protein [Patulibacter sp. SYSU D01012]
MSLATTLDRIAEIRSLADPYAAQRAAAAQQAAQALQAQKATAAGTAGSGLTSSAQATARSFPAALQAAQGGGGGGEAMVAAARTKLGVAEQPPGSNDSPEIKTFRDAVAGAPGPGPWCAYFVSWAAKQAGTPVGDNGSGFGSVDAMWSWAQRSGKSIPNGPNVRPQVGDVIIFDEHTGIVTGVDPDGTVRTIEGNTSDRVAERTHPANAAVGYIRLH